MRFREQGRDISFPGADLSEVVDPLGQFHLALSYAIDTVRFALSTLAVDFCF
jgi:hypothetical protein